MHLNNNQSLRYITSRLNDRLASFYHNQKSYLQYSDIAILGAYFNGNIGDISMGKQIQLNANTKSYTSQLINYSHQRKPQAKKIIMGGGELGNTENFQKLLNNFSPDTVSVCGINPTNDLDKTCPEKLKDLIYQIPYISCRSSLGVNYLNNFLNRNNIVYQPDICWTLALSDKISKVKSNTNPNASKKIIGINAIPFYMILKNQKYFVPDFPLMRYLKYSSPHFL